MPEPTLLEHAKQADEAAAVREHADYTLKQILVRAGVAAQRTAHLTDETVEKTHTHLLRFPRSRPSAARSPGGPPSPGRCGNPVRASFDFTPWLDRPCHSCAVGTVAMAPRLNDLAISLESSGVNDFGIRGVGQQVDTLSPHGLVDPRASGDSYAISRGGRMAGFRSNIIHEPATISARTTRRAQ